jgi:hypothetical protein
VPPSCINLLTSYSTLTTFVLAITFFFIQTTSAWALPGGHYIRPRVEKIVRTLCLIQIPILTYPQARDVPKYDYQKHHHHPHTSPTVSGTGTGTGTGSWPTPTGSISPPFPTSNYTGTIAPTGTGSGYPSGTGYSGTGSGYPVPTEALKRYWM